MSTDDVKKPRTPLLLVAACFVFVQGCFLLLPQLFEPWRGPAIDRLFQLRSGLMSPAYDDTVVHVDLSDASLRSLGDFHPTRSHHARVIENLARMKVAALAYDFIFAGASNSDEDDALRQAIAAAGNVYLGMAARLEPRGTQPEDEPATPIQPAGLGWQLDVPRDDGALRVASAVLDTWEPIASASRGLGTLNVTPDRDGVVRRIPLLVRFGGELLPTLALRVVSDYLGVPPERIVVRPGRSITLGDARRPGAAEARDLVIPIDEEGNLILDYIGPWDRMTHYDFADVARAADDRFELERWREELSGKIVLVSEISTGSADVGPVPTDPSFPLSGVHATAIHNLLTGRFLRGLASTTALALELLLAVVVGALALRLRGRTFAVACLCLGVGCAAAVAAAFLFANIVADPVRPLMFLSAATVLVVVYRVSAEERAKEALRRTCDAYFPPSVVAKIMQDPDSLTRSARRAEITILFSDIENFTRHSATREPAEIRAMLNEYFEEMTEIVFAHGGTMDKFIGDAVMVLFGDSDPQPDHALRCVQTAIEMQQRIAELHAKWKANGGMPLRVRIGINTGDVVVGNLGSERRFAYTATGSAVNLAQRIESNARIDAILVSNRTAEFIRDQIPLRPVAPIQAKGFDEPVEVFEVVTSQETSEAAAPDVDADVASRQSSRSA